MLAFISIPPGAGAPARQASVLPMPLSMARRLALGLVAALAALALTIAGFVLVHSQDAPPVADADLRLERAPVQDAANGFLRLAEAAAELAWSEEDRLEVEAMALQGAWEGDRLQQIVARNERALALLEVALRLPGFESRPALERVSDDPPDMLPWLELAHLAMLRAGLRAEAGDASGVLADAFLPIRLGQLVQSDTSSVLIHGMFGAALKGIAVRDLPDLLPHVRPTPGESRAAARALDSLRTDASAWRAMWSGEYRVMSASFTPFDVAQVLGEEGEASARRIAALLPAAYAYQPNATIGAYAQVIRELRSHAGEPCAALRPEAEPRAGRLARIADALRPNGGGLLMLRQGAGRLLYFELRRCESDAGLAALQALIALRAHQVEHGTLPATLQELVPRYLDALPIDAYDGEPLRYDAGRRRLLSVGTRLPVAAPDVVPDDKSFLKPEFDVPF